MLTSSTFAALTIASAPSTIAANERVSNKPNASAMTLSPYLVCDSCEMFGLTAAAFHLAAGDAVDRLLGGFGGDIDVLFVTAKVDASEAAERANLQNVDLGGFLRFVRSEGRIGGRRALHREQRVAGQNHVAVARAVDEHRVIIVDAANHAVAVDLRLVTAFFFQAERVKNGGARLTDVGLRFGMNLKHPVQALDDLHPRRDLC